MPLHPFRIPNDTLPAETEDHRLLQNGFQPAIAAGTYLTEACGVSNDPPAIAGDATDDAIPDGYLYTLKICNITQYQCPNNGESEEAAMVIVPFDYDVHYNPRFTDQSFSAEILPFLEESILESVAQGTGVIEKCIAGASSNGKRHRWIRARRSVEESEPISSSVVAGDLYFADALRQLIVGISLSPRDIVDRRFIDPVSATPPVCTSPTTNTTSTNIVPVETRVERNQETGAYENVTTYTTETVVEVTKCIPIRGGYFYHFLGQRETAIGG
jgi:hypothetical protein